VTSIDQDMVFSDESQYQMASITGNDDTTLMASLLVGIAA
jgi:hypothetical protein